MDLIFGFPLRINKGGVRGSLVFRPHIDIPPLTIRYWPWDTGIVRVRRDNAKNLKNKVEVNTNLERQKKLEARAATMSIEEERLISKFVHSVLLENQELIERLKTNKKKLLNGLMGSAIQKIKKCSEDTILDSKSETHLKLTAVDPLKIKTVLIKNIENWIQDNPKELNVL